MGAQSRAPEQPRISASLRVGYLSSSPFLYRALGKEAAVGPAELWRGFVQHPSEEAGMAAWRTSSATLPRSSKIWEQLAGDEGRHSLDFLRAENVILREGTRGFFHLWKQQKS